MIRYALDEEGRAVSSFVAGRKTNYKCPECGSSLRLRRGEFVRPHFYHLHLRHCESHPGKSERHQEVQTILRAHFHLPKEAEEKIFPSIERRADLVHEEKKWVFEIQCSPLSAEEALSRKSDYGSLGYKVIWLLDCHLFDQKGPTSLEHFCLQESFLYFDLSDKGLFFYERLFLLRENRFLWRSDPRKVDPLILVGPSLMAEPLSLLYQKVGISNPLFQGSLFEKGDLSVREGRLLAKAIEKKKGFLYGFALWKRVLDLLLEFCSG